MAPSKPSKLGHTTPLFILVFCFQKNQIHLASLSSNPDSFPSPYTCCFAKVRAPSLAPLTVLGCDTTIIVEAATNTAVFEVPGALGQFHAWECA